MPTDLLQLIALVPRSPQHLTLIFHQKHACLLTCRTGTAEHS